MQNAFTPLVSLYQSQLEASRRFADALFAGTEKIDRVMIGATHRAFTEQLQFVQDLASANDPRSAGSALQSGFLSRQPERAMNYQTELFRVVSEVQSDIGRTIKDYVEEVSARPKEPVAAPVQTEAPAGTTMFNPVTSMFSVWESAFKEVAALAQKNMMGARSAGTATEDAASSVASATSAIASAAAGRAAEAGEGSGGIMLDSGATDEKRSPGSGSTRRK